MKRIGLLGGMSWTSSAEYYRLLNTLVAESVGGLHSADLVMISVDFAEVEAMQVEGRWDDAGKLLALAAQQLESAGAEVVLLCTNTMHKVADVVQDAIAVPLLHLGDATADAALAAGMTKVGLLGTAFTMEESFYRLRLASQGLEVVVPGAEDRAMVHRVIYDELCRDIVREESRTAYVEVIERLAAQGCEGIVLGCTEIELLIRQQDSSLPVLATTRLHAEAAVRFSLS